MDRRFRVRSELARVSCKPFEVEGASAEVCPSGMWGVLFRLRSPRCEVINLSKGGMAVETTMNLPRGRRVVVRLSVPEHADVLTLSGRIRWHKRLPHSQFYTVGIQFDPFANKEGCNSVETLAQLRALEAGNAD